MCRRETFWVIVVRALLHTCYSKHYHVDQMYASALSQFPLFFHNESNMTYNTLWFNYNLLFTNDQLHFHWSYYFLFIFILVLSEGLSCWPSFDNTGWRHHHLITSGRDHLSNSRVNHAVCSAANNRTYPNVDFMLGQDRRRWSNIKIKSTFLWQLAFAE